MICICIPYNEYYIEVLLRGNVFITKLKKYIYKIKIIKYKTSLSKNKNIIENERKLYINSIKKVFSRSYVNINNKLIQNSNSVIFIYKVLYINNIIINKYNLTAFFIKNKEKFLKFIQYCDYYGNSEFYIPNNVLYKHIIFNKYPIKIFYISSYFTTSRKHPILHYRRPHSGIDLVAPLGTKIYSTGDGYIVYIGYKNGYGNTITIKHNEIYSTIYCHMMKFKHALSFGTYVKRGQIIGYIGNTGLSTGPHCHYEFRIKNLPKNPLTINLNKKVKFSDTEIFFFHKYYKILLSITKNFLKISNL